MKNEQPSAKEKQRSQAKLLLALLVGCILSVVCLQGNSAVQGGQAVSLHSEIERMDESSLSFY